MKVKSKDILMGICKTLLPTAILLLSGTVTAQVKPAVKTGPKAAKAKNKPEAMTPQELAARDFIAVLADGRGDSILVRWAPSSLIAWQWGNRTGYRLERYTVLKNGKVDEAMLRKPSLVIDTIRSLSKAGWEQLMLLDERAAIVSSGIYNEDFKPVGAGATMAEMINIKEQYDAKMGFSLFACDLNPLFAKGAGLMYVDKDVRPGERYLYRVSLADKSREKRVEPGNALRSPGERQTLPRPDIVGIEWGDRTASITWDTKKDVGIYTAYYLEKSTDSINYTMATDLPIVSGSENKTQTKNAYVDSLADNENRTFYRMRGITPFGETGPYANAAGGRGRSGFEVLPVIRNGRADTKAKTVMITWRFNEEFIGEVKGFQVLRAKAAEGPYTEVSAGLLGVGDTIFTDKAPEASNYYKVKAISKLGGVSLSFPYLVMLADEEPPIAPLGIRGIVSDSGVVRLAWKQNREKDLLGYKVYRANNLKEDFTEITPDFLTRNELFDTIEVNTLTKKVFYKVVAVDVNFNSSAYSEPFELKRPDVVPPAKPLFTNARMAKGGIQLEWVPSASVDVERYVLQRVNKKDGSGKVLLDWNPQRDKVNPVLTDTTAVMGNVYFYTLTATDGAGNAAVGRSGEIDYETGLRGPVRDFTATADTKLRTVNLRWSYPLKAETWYLYRCKKGEPMVLYQTLEGNINQWKEDRLAVGFVYQYQIKAELKGDLRTEISRIVEVKY
jgi:uncharacterized protein